MATRVTKAQLLVMLQNERERNSVLQADLDSAKKELYEVTVQLNSTAAELEELKSEMASSLSEAPKVNEIILPEASNRPRDYKSLSAVCKDIAQQGFISRIKSGAVQYMSGGKWYDYHY